MLLVERLRPEPLWEPLRERGVFTAAMLEELRVRGWRWGRGGCGLRGASPLRPAGTVRWLGCLSEAVSRGKGPGALQPGTGLYGWVWGPTAAFWVPTAMYRALRPPTRTLQPGTGPYGHLPGPYKRLGGPYSWVWVPTATYWDPTAGFGAPQLCMGPYSWLRGSCDRGHPLVLLPPNPRAHSLAVLQAPQWGLQGKDGWWGAPEPHPAFFFYPHRVSAHAGSRSGSWSSTWRAAGSRPSPCSS